ncbi:MAG: hypothetical protein MPJ78_12950 [Hyphomicrobiaceae bacterium]|nr:hypothetical protein [Hyphomicrobiaceae bacterium]
MGGKTQKTEAAPDPWDIGFGAALFVFALVALFIWFPNDIRGGFVETDHAGKIEPGDAFFPVLLACAILALSATHVLKVLLLQRHTGEDGAHAGLSRDDLMFLVLFNLVVVCGLAAMYWLGPLAVSIANAISGNELTYRQMVDTFPYKYIGYGVGGFIMTASLIAWAEAGLRWQAIVAVMSVIAVSIVVFDILLINVQLPPNADY